MSKKDYITFYETVTTDKKKIRDLWASLPDVVKVETINGNPVI